MGLSSVSETSPTLALTRAKFGCRVAVSAARAGPHLDFVQAAVGAVRREMELAESQTTPDPGPGPIPGELVGEEGEVVRYVAERGLGLSHAATRSLLRPQQRFRRSGRRESCRAFPSGLPRTRRTERSARPSWRRLGRPVCRSLLDRISRRRSLLSPLEIEASASYYRRSTGGSCCTSPCSSALLTTSRWVRASTSRWNREQTAGCVRQARFVSKGGRLPSQAGGRS